MRPLSVKRLVTFLATGHTNWTFKKIIQLTVIPPVAQD